jgi:hypothetical protein
MFSVRTGSGRTPWQMSEEDYRAVSRPLESHAFDLLDKTIGTASLPRHQRKIGGHYE